MGNRQYLNIETPDPHLYCPDIKKYFDSPFYKKSSKWKYSADPVFKLVKLVNFKKAHTTLGCQMLYKIYNICPREILVPVISLLCQCPEYTKQNNIIDILKRDEDNAVGIVFEKTTIYLLPTSFFTESTENLKSIKEPIIV
jgi:hypothetical protein